MSISNPRLDVPSSPFDTLPDELYEKVIHDSGLSAWRLQCVSRSFRDRTASAIDSLQHALFLQLKHPLVPIKDFYLQKISEIKTLDPQCNLREKERIFHPALYREIDELADRALVCFFSWIGKESLSNISFLKEASEIRAWMYAHPEELNKITTLDLANTSIRSLPPELNLFKNLVYLDLSHTKIKALPQRFNPPHLKEIFLENTLLSTFPKDFNPPNLEILHLCDSGSFASFPEGFNPPKLNWLDLTNTSFIGFPEEFEASMIRTLYLSNTPIQTLPKGIAPSLENLYIDGTPLESTHK